jgi:hypothetical protein
MSECSDQVRRAPFRQPLTITSLATRTRCPNQQCWLGLQLTLTLIGSEYPSMASYRDR